MHLNNCFQMLVELEFATGNNAKGEKEVHRLLQRKLQRPEAELQTTQPMKDMQCFRVTWNSLMFLEMCLCQSDKMSLTKSLVFAKYVGFSLSSTSLQLSKTSLLKQEQQSLRLFHKVARLFSPQFFVCVSSWSWFLTRFTVQLGQSKTIKKY